MTQLNNFSEERRSRNRETCFFPVQVRGRYPGGRLFEINTHAENISTGGLYLQIPHTLNSCERLFTLTHLPGGACLAALSLIVRLETQSYRQTGVGLRFSRSRLIPATSW